MLVDFAAEGLRRADTLAAFATVRRARARVAAAGLRDFDLELVRALAPAFDFFELFFTEDIRGSLLPRSARQARNTLTGEAIRVLAMNGQRFGQITDPPALCSSPSSGADQKPAESESRVEKGSGNGALWQSTGEAVRSES